MVVVKGDDGMEWFSVCLRAPLMDLLDPAKVYHIQATMGAVGGWNPLNERPITGPLTEKFMNEWPCRPVLGASLGKLQAKCYCLQQPLSRTQSLANNNANLLRSPSSSSRSRPSVAHPTRSRAATISRQSPISAPGEL